MDSKFKRGWSPAFLINNYLIKQVKQIFIFFILFFTSFDNLSASDYQLLLEKVKNLKIGIGSYYIGENYNSKSGKPIESNYPGVLKFQEKDIFISVDKERNIIIGLYKYFKHVNTDILKKTVSQLMINFGEPTLEAHDKNIYWFFDEKGKILSEQFSKAKKENDIKTPLLMVKLNSDISLSKLSDKNFQDNTTFYYIIYSEPLMKKLN